MGDNSGVLFDVPHGARFVIRKRLPREKPLLPHRIHPVLLCFENILDFEFIESLKLGKSLRENADYYGDFSADGAEGMIESAADFLKSARKILRKK